MTEVKQSGNNFELFVDGKKAGLMNFQTRENGDLNIVHTEVDDEFGGQGLGKELVDAAVNLARTSQKKLTSSCSYAKSVLEKDADVADVYDKN